MSVFKMAVIGDNELTEIFGAVGFDTFTSPTDVTGDYVLRLEVDTTDIRTDICVEV